jgi:hypothetical protein
MGDTRTQLNAAIQHLKEIRVGLDHELQRLKELRKILDQPVAQLKNWSVPRDSMSDRETPAASKA